MTMPVPIFPKLGKTSRRVRKRMIQHAAIAASHQVVTNRNMANLRRPPAGEVLKCATGMEGIRANDVNLIH